MNPFNKHGIHHLVKCLFLAFSVASASAAVQWSTVRHVWGEDLSGSLQGAGGIGGLLRTTHAAVLSDGKRETEHEQTPAEHTFHYDSNGNIILLTDAQANESARYSYDAFGKTLTATGPAAKANRYRFSTKPAEEESALVYYGYRYYDPVTGRWPSRDPIGEKGGFNIYAAGSNGYPYKADVLGLEEFHFNSLTFESTWFPAQVESSTEDLCNSFRAGILTIKVWAFMPLEQAEGVIVKIDGGHGVIQSNGEQTWVEKGRTLQICPKQMEQRTVPITISDGAGPITISSSPGGWPNGKVLNVNLSYKCTECGDGGCGGNGTVANFELTYSLSG